MSKTDVSTFLIDGLWGWSPRMRRLATSLEAGGIRRPIIYSYNSSGNELIESLAEQFVAKAKKCGPFQVVAHSLGGLVVRTAMLLNPSLELQKAVFINVPHRGSLLAYLLPLRGIKQLQPRSKLMRQLHQQSWTVPNLSIWCPYDLMVVPGSSAKWAHATELERCDVPAHNWPVFSKAYHRRIVRFLRN